MSYSWSVGQYGATGAYCGLCAVHLHHERLVVWQQDVEASTLVQPTSFAFVSTVVKLLSELPSGREIEIQHRHLLTASPLAADIPGTVAQIFDTHIEAREA
ncbi:MAG: hypothetical protein R2748_23295 [Bryobacterales bacterium]